MLKRKHDNNNERNRGCKKELNKILRCKKISKMKQNKCMGLTED